VTTIAIVKTPMEIYLGADSNQGWGGRVWPVCKILRCDSFFYALAGLASYGLTNYSIEGTVGRALRQAGTIEDRINIFVENWMWELRSALLVMKRNDPTDYERYKNYAGIFLTFLDGESPRALSIDLTAEGDTLLFTPTNTELTIKEGRGKAVCLNGQTRHIRSFMEAHPTYVEENTPTNIIDTLIGVEIENVPEAVGPPIDILRLTKEGPSWFRRKEQCFDL
jgi:hypothetical protein